MEVEEEAREEEATDGGASERVAADGTWEAAFWDASCEHPKQQVLLDVLHAMKRIRDTIPAQHTLRDRFMSRFRDLLSCVNDEDIKQVMAELIKGGWSREDVEHLYDSSYGYFIRKIRRLVPKPQEMLPKYAELIQAYTPTVEHPLRGYCPDTRLYLLGKSSTQDKLKRLEEHMRLGCLSDPENLALYVNTGNEEKPRCTPPTSPRTARAPHSPTLA